MRIKKFVGDTLQEALARVKRDFGAEAVILYTRVYKKGGVFGVFGRKKTEVTAGIDINVERKDSGNREKDILLNAKKGRAEMGGVKMKQPFSGRGFDDLNTYRRVEDVSLKNEVLSRELNEGKISLNTALRPIKEGAGRVGLGLKNGLGRMQKILLDNGVEENLVFRALQNINSQLSDTQINNRQYMESYLYNYMADLIQVSGPIKVSSNGTKVVAFIGPTGVGKTTTLAKIAAKCALIDNKNVVMVSADTYRIGADIQLKKYGEIIGVPVEIVLTPQDLKKVINKHIDKDLILIDTAGRSPRNRKFLIDLKDFLEAYSPVETHLVMSAVTKYYDALNIINNFGLVPIHRILFTKLDETKNYGLLLNMSVSSGGIPVSYLTVGQAVPDDIEAADARVISRLILKGDFEAWIRQKN